jgi:NADPH-dependent curcumin reductase CurA
MTALLKKRIRVQGFIIFDDYGSHFPEFRKQMKEWFEAGKIKYREDVVSGLENAPEAFMGLLKGKNFGKLVVRVAAETAS